MKEIKKKYEGQLLKIEGVVGVDYNSSIIVYVKEDTARIRSFVARTLEGVPVKIIRTGRLPILSIPIVSAIYHDRTEKFRPMVGGISMGHPEVTAGTLSGFLIRGDKLLGLSNMHVACPNWGDTKLGGIGDPVYQPGVYDGGTSQDECGEVLDFEPVYLDRYNRIDAAVFTPSVEAKREVLEIGVPSHSVEPVAGMRAKKSGARSGVTYSQVVGDSATLEIEGYGVAIFEDVFVMKPACAIPGDSGSLIVDENDRPVGVVFAGSPYVTVGCRAKLIEQRFNGVFALALPYIPLSTVLLPVGAVGLVVAGGGKRTV